MNGNSDWEIRTELLFGKEKLEVLHKSHVLIVGLGGVGACAAEMLCRSGIGMLTIVDGDTVQFSNLNRQIIAFNSNMGQKKAHVMLNRLKDINPKIIVNIIDDYITDAQMPELFNTRYDYVVDAIDTLTPKVQLIFNSIKNNISIVSSMGSGGKSDPSLVKVADISESHSCKLAHYIRKRLHKLGIYNGVKVVFSSEAVDKKSTELIKNEKNKRTVTGTISYMPVLFGCLCSSTVIRDLSM